MLGHMSGADEASAVPSVRFDDIDIDRDDEQAELERRLMALATARIAAARARLTDLGIIGADGRPLSAELPADMQPDSDTTLETG